MTHKKAKRKRGSAPTMPAPGTAGVVSHQLKFRDRSYELRYVDCGKTNCSRCSTPDIRTPSHGPYWYLCVSHKGKWRRIYIGKDLDTSLFIDAYGRVDWKAVSRKRRRLSEMPALAEDPPGQDDMITPAIAPPGRDQVLALAPGEIDLKLAPEPPDATI